MEVMYACGPADGAAVERAVELLALVASEFPPGTERKVGDFLRESVPAWLQEGLGEPLGEMEEQAWLEAWRAASADERAPLERERPWSLQDWLYWMEPGNRTWRDPRSSSGESRPSLTIEVLEWPTAIGAIEITLKAAGATVAQRSLSGGTTKE